MTPTSSSLRQVQGFTLVELLVAIALLGMLLAVIIPGITALLGINRTGERDLTATTQAQRVLEEVKGAWQVQDNYDRNCAPGLVLPSGVTLQSRSLDSRARNPGTLGSVSVGASCPVSTGTAPVMRRVTVTAGTGTQATTLTLDVLRPQ
ncbi:type II secretion system protein [Deinococcus planocerae]|uniref:type II secretion system protein n=1 Tax=Deinococcus planocerae TaxID=1737569 RepID=UPI000C7EAB17|nr:type II secretion system protein [Deinococcus planocerae]